MIITNTIINEIESNNVWSDKFSRQEELEEKMRGMGIDRFWSHVAKAKERGQETGISSVHRLMNHSIQHIADGITRFIEQCESGKAGRKATAYYFLKAIEAEAAALITARVVLDGVAKGDRLVPLARRVASMIEDELAFRAFKAADKKAFKFVVSAQKKQTSYARQRMVMRANMLSRDIEWEAWDVANLVMVGTKLIEIMVETTGLIMTNTRTVDVKKQEVFVEATPMTMAWIEEENNRAEAMSPVYLPTIVPPRPWVSPTEGGYWTKRVRRLSLVKTYSKPYLEELAEHDMPEVYDAVNAMQHTAWRVNLQVLEVAKTLWESGATIGGIPSADDYPIPARPAFLDQELPKEAWSEDQMTRFKQWKRSATDTYTANSKLKSLRLQFAKVLMVAEMFQEEDVIYFPHQLDFRGRVYAIPLFLNPQGSDIAKGLLEFANAVAIDDEDAAAWLAIHGSNSFGYDKVSLQERVDWVHDNEAQILACAEDPYSNKFWADADKPFQFLAFCFDWAGFRKGGFGYLSSLPIAMDGSCNGLQNFSAMLRDEVGGAAVNLIPSAVPADIYQEVANLVIEQVQKDAEGGDEIAELARGWLKHGITRKVCKRPVMTLAYGAKEFGFKTQVFEDTVMPFKFEAKGEFPWEGSGWKAADYMGKLIWHCVARVVVAARSAMDWLQKAARLAAKEGLPVRWNTPDNLVVLQAYPKMLTRRIDLTFNGARHYLTVALQPTQELDKARQANGISPNWVHSMDASHMRATVRRGWEEGLRSFSLIHDSYGTHAGNAVALGQMLREEFVSMYEKDVLEEFKSDLMRQLPDDAELEDLPAKGTLDLSQVLRSDFFFA